MVLDLDRAVGKRGQRDEVAIALAGLVDRVGQDLEGGMSAAVKAIGAEDDRRTKADALLVFQLANAVVAVIGRGVCHSRSFDDSVSSSAASKPLGAKLLSRSMRGAKGATLLAGPVGQTLLARCTMTDFTTCRARNATRTQQIHRTYVRIWRFARMGLGQRACSPQRGAKAAIAGALPQVEAPHNRGARPFGDNTSRSGAHRSARKRRNRTLTG